MLPLLLLFLLSLLQASEALSPNRPWSTETCQSRHSRLTTPIGGLALCTAQKMTSDQDIDSRLLANIVAKARGDMGYGKGHETQTLIEHLRQTGTPKVFTDEGGRMTRLMFISHRAKQL